MAGRIVGVDIGGTHITAGLVDLTNNRLDDGAVVRKAVNAHGKAEQIVEEWASCITGLTAGWGPADRIGIAMPGPFDYEKGISFIKSQGKYDALFGMKVKSLLADRLRVDAEQIRFENDAACFLRGEVVAGSARGADSAVGITLGTGLGSSSYADGDANDAALWNMPFKEGIVEDYLSTRWFLREYEQRTGQKIAGVKEMIRPESYGNPARSLFSEFADNLSTFLTMFVRREKAQAAVIGGNIARAHAFFLPIVRSNLKTAGVDVSVDISELGEHAAMIGAACTWHNQNLKVNL